MPHAFARLTVAGLALLAAGCVSTIGTPTPSRPVPLLTATSALTVTAEPAPSQPPASPTPSRTPTAQVATPTGIAPLPPTPTGLPLTSPTARALAIPSNPTNARSWDWRRVIATDPDLNHPDVPDFGVDMGPYVEVRGAAGLVAAQGYAMVSGSDVVFVDLDSDGVQEAAVQLFSGGTAGNTGLLVYKTTDRYPKMIDHMGGYKLWAVADGRELLVTEPVYAGWEPNCCPSGSSQTRYRLEGGRLLPVARSESGIPDTRVLTVEEFYSRLARRDYEGAYAFLSPFFKAANPFATWKTGYASTASIEARVSELPDGRVGVELSSVDDTQAGRVTRRYRGTWSLVWSSDASQWLLDAAEIAALG